ITDPDCGDDAALAKVEFMGYSDECCGIEIPAACYTVDELLCGVKLGDLGELKLVDGKLVFKADPMSDGSKSLAEGQTAVLSFVAVASDGECIDTDRFDIHIKGGNDAPTIDICDMTIQLASDCVDCDDDAQLSDSAAIIVKDIDCGDVASLKNIMFLGVGDHTGDPLATWEANQLNMQAVGDYGFLQKIGDNIFFLVNEDNPDLIKLKAGETLTLNFAAVATDGVCDSFADCFTVTITGANDKPMDGNELCALGGYGVNNLTENQNLTSGFNLLANATDPDMDALHISAVNLPTINVAGIVISSFDDGISGTYSFKLTSTSGVSILTVEEDGDTTLIHQGDGAMDILNEGDHAVIKFGYTVSDGECTDPSKAEICIEGEKDYECVPFPDNGKDLSNLVLYLDNPETAEFDIVKVKFDGGCQNQFENTCDVYDWIGGHDNLLNGHTELVAFSFKAGSNFEGGFNEAALGPGEGQLVFLSDGITAGPLSGDVVLINKNGAAAPDKVIDVNGDLVGTGLDVNTAAGLEILGRHADITNPI
ncbi:MAG: VCBS domain-containing protein, partial [Alphaproteobacteria bacterium]|nr:VCBS domain-containing protein [Alphaproteobacteria bacterium]